MSRLRDLSPEGVARAKEAAAHAPVVPPDHLRLTEEEKRVFDFTTGAMLDIGMEPEFMRIEWAGADAIALRRKGLNAISLGAGENQPHSRRERVVIDDLVNSTRLIRSLVSRAAASAVVGGPAGVALPSAS